MTDAAVAGPQVIIGLGIAIFVMIYLVLKTRVHALLALIIAASLAGLIGGMPPNEVISAITTGFGKTLSTIGLVIGFGVMMGRVLVITAPALIALVIYARIMGPRIEAMLEALPGGFEGSVKHDTDSMMPESELPSLLMSCMPIGLPIALIFLNTLIGAVMGDASNALTNTVAFIGNPVIAVGLGVLVAIYGLMPKTPKQEVFDHLEKGVETAGIILLVTGAGGALGSVLRASGGGDYIAMQVAALGLQPLLIPFIIATLVRFIQGSGTVSMITAASISAPILMGMPDVNMVLAAQAACIGAMFFSYFNDSYFWVVNRMLGVKSTKHQMLVLTLPTTLAWAISIITLLLLNAIVG
ncbi:MAG: GntP family permease [Cobetia crustatorum]